MADAAAQHQLQLAVSDARARRRRPRLAPRPRKVLRVPEGRAARAAVRDRGDVVPSGARVARVARCGAPLGRRRRHRAHRPQGLLFRDPDRAAAVSLRGRAPLSVDVVFRHDARGAVARRRAELARRRDGLPAVEGEEAHRPDPPSHVAALRQPRRQVEARRTLRASARVCATLPGELRRALPRHLLGHPAAAPYEPALSRPRGDALSQLRRGVDQVQTDVRRTQAAAAAAALRRALSAPLLLRARPSAMGRGRHRVCAKGVRRDGGLLQPSSRGGQRLARFDQDEGQGQPPPSSCLLRRGLARSRRRSDEHRETLPKGRRPACDRLDARASHEESAVLRLVGANAGAARAA
mmetsp:Transcript_34599/g.76041  ORF Transcript_34599/g.76041 Transcript_34599/m.76041 type:complete len:352 (+) Transcript_34599:440-1495(+)